MIPVAISAATLPDHADLHRMKRQNTDAKQDIHIHCLSLDRRGPEINNGACAAVGGAGGDRARSQLEEHQ
jgi:hypothetical protein